MSDVPVFRHDLYRGTAEFYDRFRLRYPDDLIEDLCRRTGADGTGRLLDLACGPGTVTFALADRFAEVWAVDLEPESVEFAARKAAEAGIDNIHWLSGRAEEVALDVEFDLVTIGTAFHRLDRVAVADNVMRGLRPGSHLALLWSTTPLSVALFAPDGLAPWQRALKEAMVHWMERSEAADRLPPTLAAHLTQLTDDEVLQAAGFVVDGRYEFTLAHDWKLEELSGFMYSTSLLSLSVLGDNVGAFEADLRDRLLAAEPSGVFHEDVSFAYHLAHRP